MQAENTITTTAEPPALRRRAKTARSAVSNGTKLLMADGRSPWSRRFRDIVVGHCNDLGGYESLSQAELAIIKRAATLQVELEVQEARLANGDTPKGFSLVEFAQVSNGLRRLLEAIGLKRVSRDITPSLADLLREQHDAAPVRKPVHASKPSAGTAPEADDATPSHEAPEPATEVVE